MEAAPGFEPGNDGFANRCPETVSVANETPSVIAENNSAVCSALSDPQLLLVAKHWVTLPHAVRKGIVVMVCAYEANADASS